MFYFNFEGIVQNNKYIIRPMQNINFMGALFTEITLYTFFILILELLNNGTPNIYIYDYIIFIRSRNYQSMD